MKTPFQLKIQNNLNVTVDQAEINYNRGYGKSIFTGLSYLIDNKIYTGFSNCVPQDQFNKKYGRRLAELRLINNYRKRININKIPVMVLEEILDIEFYIKDKVNKLKYLNNKKEKYVNSNSIIKLNKNIEVALEHQINETEYQIDSYEDILTNYWE